MLTRLIHQLASNTWVYDQLQSIVGSRVVQQRLARQIGPLATSAKVLDIGGGTGIVRTLFPRSSQYVCLDIDPVKLDSFVRKHPGDTALLADASAIPLKTSSINTALCTNVSHHIPDALFSRFMGESMRVLKEDGCFIFHDAVWDDSRPISRLLWKYDRGSFPRTLKTLHSLLSAHGRVIHWEEYSIYHHYVLGLVVPAANIV